jgi:hypothetical protein
MKISVEAVEALIKQAEENFKNDDLKDNPYYQASNHGIHCFAETLIWCLPLRARMEEEGEK